MKFGIDGAAEDQGIVCGRGGTRDQIVERVLQVASRHLVGLDKGVVDDAGVGELTGLVEQEHFGGDARAEHLRHPGCVVDDVGNLHAQALGAGLHPFEAVLGVVRRIVGVHQEGAGALARIRVAELDDPLLPGSSRTGSGCR